MTKLSRLIMAIAFAHTACGYHAVYGGEGERLSVVLKRSLVPDAVATDDVVTGVREALAREGALASGEGYPRIEVEVLRVDESSDGVATVTGLALPSSSPRTLSARARASDVGLVARACLVRSADGPCERDTGDVRAFDLAASEVAPGASAALGDAFQHRDVLRAVGKRLGERLASHVLGTPTSTDEAIGREH